MGNTCGAFRFRSGAGPRPVSSPRFDEIRAAFYRGAASRADPRQRRRLAKAAGGRPMSFDAAFVTQLLVGNLAYLLLIISMVMTRMLWLRLFAIGSGIVGTAY